MIVVLKTRSASPPDQQWCSIQKKGRTAAGYQNHFQADLLCRVTSLKQRVTAVAAANKHTAILTDAGAIFSWGSNDQGQLGYGTSDSASNALPRQVEAMKVSHDMAPGAFGAVMLCLCVVMT